MSDTLVPVVAADYPALAKHHSDSSKYNNKTEIQEFFTVLEEGEGWELHSLVCFCLRKSSFEQVYVIV